MVASLRQSLDLTAAFVTMGRMRIFRLLALLILLPSFAAAPPTRVDHAGLKKLSWQLAARASTFREMTTFEMIDLLHEMDLHHIELSPGQSLSAEQKDAKIDPTMSDKDLDALLAKLKAVKMDIVSFGVADFGSTEADARKVFEFGKKLKLKTIITDAPPETLEMLDKLATEYQINIALSSATAAKRYINPDTTMAAVKDRSARIGISAELAAFKLARQDSADYIKKLNTRILLVHISDVDSQGKPVALGTGTVDAGQALTALRDQKFKGICCVEDDSESAANRLEGFAKSVSAFSDVLTEISR